MTRRPRTVGAQKELFDDADIGDGNDDDDDDDDCDECLSRKELRTNMDGSALMALVVEAGGARALEKLDPNRDGKITPDEIYKVLFGWDALWMTGEEGSLSKDGTTCR